MHITLADKKKLLIEALSYIQKFKDRIIVIKYGGAAMLKEELKQSFAQDIVLLKSLGMQPVIVHGGGPEVSRAMERLNQKVTFIDGLRVTTEENLKVAEMVLSGTINKEIIAHLNLFGAKSVGLSGKDAHLIEAEKLISKGVDLGFVGEVVSINPDILHLLINDDYIPVVSPIGLSKKGVSFNINADTVAARVAVALKAKKLILLTDVHGIKDESKLVSHLTSEKLKHYISIGVINGGMVAKSKAIIYALNNGIDSAHIINGCDKHSLISELFTDEGTGSKVVLN